MAMRTLHQILESLAELEAYSYAAWEADRGNAEVSILNGKIADLLADLGEVVGKPN